MTPCVSCTRYRLTDAVFTFTIAVFMWKKFIEMLIAAGVIAEDKQQSVRDLATKFETENPEPKEVKKTDPPTPPNSGDDARSATSIERAVAGLNEKIEVLGAALEKANSRAEASERALEESRKEKATKEIQEAVAAAVKSGRIENNEEKIAFWKKRLEVDFDGNKAVLEGLKPDPALATKASDGADEKKGEGASQDKKPLGSFVGAADAAILKSVTEQLG